MEIETFEVAYSRRLVRLLQLPAVFHSVAALTGVAVTFCPLFLFWFGRDGVAISDLRVTACFVVIYGVSMVYMSLGSRALQAIWQRRKSNSDAH